MKIVTNPHAEQELAQLAERLTTGLSTVPPPLNLFHRRSRITPLR
jgi:hypothetical protein